MFWDECVMAANVKKEKSFDLCTTVHVSLYLSFVNSEAPLWFPLACWVWFHVHRAQIQSHIHRVMASALCRSASSFSHAQQYAHVRMWACMPPRWNLPTSQPLRCAALNRQWLIYGMIVYFAVLSVMDEDLCAFEKSVWNMVESGGEGLFLKSTSPRRNTSGPMGRPAIIPSPRLKLNAPP